MKYELVREEDVLDILIWMESESGFYISAEFKNDETIIFPIEVVDDLVKVEDDSLPDIPTKNFRLDIEQPINEKYDVTDDYKTCQYCDSDFADLESDTVIMDDMDKAVYLHLDCFDMFLDDLAEVYLDKSSDIITDMM